MAKGGVVQDITADESDTGVYIEDGPEGRFAVVWYVKEESVGLAVDLLDEAEIRPGVAVRVAPYVLPPGKKRRKKNPAASSGKFAQSNQKVLLAADARSKLVWDEDTYLESAKQGKIVVLRHVFTLEDVAGHPGGMDGFIEETRADIEEEASRCGLVHKITVHARNPNGIVTVRFDTRDACNAAIALFDGRWFAGRKLECAFWDLKENFAVKETREEEEKRLQKFEEWLEAGGDHESE